MAAKSIGPLAEGGHVVILGGGPAGTSCALALKRTAAQMGRQVRVTMVEGKQFAGERHYNQCVGVLSPPLPVLLENQLDLPFPRHLARARITGYTLHFAGQHLALPDEEEPSIAVRRVQFDAYMLEQARDHGVEVLTARAVDLEFHADGVLVYTDNAPRWGDVVVGAFGLDEGTASLLTRLTGYRPPNTLSSVVTKYHPGDEAMEAFGTCIHAFLPRHRRIEFGAITPKGNHLTINIAGRTVDAPLMRSFLSQPEVRAELIHLDRAGHYDPNDLRFFKGRFPCSQAQNYYGDRFVMVGDAAGLVRSFKGKGVTSAVQTGIRAAETILTAGVSQRSFNDHFRRANRDIIGDLPYGQAMRLVTILMARYGLMKAVLRAAQADAALRSAVFGAVSGHAPYREVLAAALRPGVVATLLRTAFHHPPARSEVITH